MSFLSFIMYNYYTYFKWQTSWFVMFWYLYMSLNDPSEYHFRDLKYLSFSMVSILHIQLFWKKKNTVLWFLLYKRKLICNDYLPCPPPFPHALIPSPIHFSHQHKPTLIICEWSHLDCCPMLPGMMSSGLFFFSPKILAVAELSFIWTHLRYITLFSLVLSITYLLPNTI